MITYTIFESVANWIISIGVIIWLTVIIVSWLASFRSPKAATIGQSKWFRLPHWAQIMSGGITILLLVGLAYLLWIPLPLTLPLGLLWVSGVVGLLFFIAGLTLILWARYALGGMYNVSTTSGVQLQASHQLIQHGPYAFVRHPMYLGHWLLLGGILLVYLTWTAVLFLLFLLPLYRRAHLEEIVLADTFGVEWEAYTSHTQFIIPFVYITVNLSADLAGFDAERQGCRDRIGNLRGLKLILMPLCISLYGDTIMTSLYVSLTVSIIIWIVLAIYL